MVPVFLFRQEVFAAIFLVSLVVIYRRLARIFEVLPLDRLRGQSCAQLSLLAVLLLSVLSFTDQMPQPSVQPSILPMLLPDFDQLKRLLLI